MSKQSTTGSQDTSNTAKILDFTEFTKSPSEGKKTNMSDTMTSGMFGSLNTDEVTSDLKNGTYLFELTDVKTFHKEDKDHPNDKTKGRHSLIFNWMVCDETDENYGEEFQQWFTIFPYLTDDEHATLPPTEKIKIKRAVNWLKNQFKNIGMTPEELNDFTPESLKESKVGLRAYIEIVVEENKDSGRSFTKPKKITLESAVDTDANGTSDFSF